MLTDNSSRIRYRTPKRWLCEVSCVLHPRAKLGRYWLDSSKQPESMDRYEADSRSAALADIRGRIATALNNVPPPPEPPERSPSPWPVNDISHLDANGVSSHQFENVNFSAGSIDEARILARSRAILERCEVEEIPIEGEPAEVDSGDPSLGPLPRRIIDGCMYISPLGLKHANGYWQSELGQFGRSYRQACESPSIGRLVPIRKQDSR